MSRELDHHFWKVLSPVSRGISIKDPLLYNASVALLHVVVAMVPAAAMPGSASKASRGANSWPMQNDISME